MNLPNFPIIVTATSPGPLEWRVRWNWDWPAWLTAVAATAALVWVVSIYLRETSPAGRGVRLLLSLLRVAALALVLGMFAQPALEWFRPGRPRLALLLDRSASMDTRDEQSASSGPVTRIDAWKALLTGDQPSLTEQLRDNYDVDIVTFDRSVTPLATAATASSESLQSQQTVADSADGTRLGDAIDYAVRELPGQPPVAVVVVTDGIATLGLSLEAAAQRARQFRVPLYTVAVGSDTPQPDVAVENLLVEEIVFPGDRIQVEATIRATGFAGQQAEVVLTDAAARDLARTTITLPPDNQLQTVRLAIRPDEPGVLAMQLAIAPRAGELNTENNVVRRTIDVRNEKIQVLLAQAQPSYEFRALKSLLERDPVVQLHTLLQEADADYPTVDDTAIGSFPTGEADLFGYDVLLLGDIDPRLLPRSVWPLVERFVAEHGGGLVGIAGPRFMPRAFRGNRSMEALLPIPLETPNPLRTTHAAQADGDEIIRVFPTALGWRTPSLQLGASRAESEQIWRGLPPLAWLLRINAVKQGAQVLADCPGQTNLAGRPLPVILRHYVGAGEVLLHATDETWRWRWRTDDRYFARYWGQVVRRLGRGRLAAGQSGVQLTADRSLYEPGETVQLQARFRNPAQAPADDDEVVLRLQGTTGPPQQVTLQRRLGRRGIFSTTVDELPPGDYEAIMIRPTRISSTAGRPDQLTFSIRQPPRELANVLVNRRALRAAAELTGGKSYTLATAAQLVEQLPPPRQQTTTAQPPRPLWNSHAAMAVLVLLLASEWTLRRRYGML